jgi:hypothetical protein
MAGGGWKTSLAAVLKEHNNGKKSGGASSYGTRDARSDTLYAGFAKLRELGFILQDVHGFRETHLKALVKHWSNLAPGTIQNRISTFRVFSDEWIHKKGMLGPTSKYVPAGVATRSSINKVDKSWSSNGVDRAALIAKVAAVDPRCGIQLELQYQFSLRPKEARLLRPRMDDQKNFLTVTNGTKGGRSRVVKIETAAQREVLDRAKPFAEKEWSSTCDPLLSLAQATRRYYKVVASCGISKAALGITSHGLRHQSSNDEYQALTGEPSPVRGGGPVDPDIDRAARLKIAEKLGHSREEISTNYLGR